MLKRIVFGMVGVLGLSVPAALGSIFQTASPYTDGSGDSVGSANAGRDIVGATITNDATNLYITLEMNPSTTTNNSDGVPGAPPTATTNPPPTSPPAVRSTT